MSLIEGLCFISSPSEAYGMQTSGDSTIASSVGLQDAALFVGPRRVAAGPGAAEPVLSSAARAAAARAMAVGNGALAALLCGTAWLLR